MVRLDGRIDWIVTQRKALVAWTGPLLTPTPKIIQSHVLTAFPSKAVLTGKAPSWGCTKLTGRGVAALSGRGFIQEISLAEDEEFIVHPRFSQSLPSNRVRKLIEEPFIGVYDKCDGASTASSFRAAISNSDPESYSIPRV